MNTVTLDGVHKVSDIWRGPAKTRYAQTGCPAQFVYDCQFLMSRCPEVSRIAHFTFEVLDAVGIRNGGAHTELVWSGQCCDSPRLCEVNPRCAGGLPRTPHYPNQLDMLVMSLYDPIHFAELPEVPGDPQFGLSASVVFLCAPRDCWLPASSLQALADLSTFARFDRGLIRQKRPFEAKSVRKTTGLCSSPGVVVLHGPEEAVKEDAERIRQIESNGYSDEPEPAEPEVLDSEVAGEPEPETST